MGLFGLGKKNEVTQKSGSSMGMSMNNELFKTLTQSSALLLLKMGVTSQPFVMNVEADSGIFAGTFRNHIINPRILALKNMSPDVYIKVCGMHMIGSGMYVCYMQEKLKKSAADFSMDEIKAIASAWESKDAYELALNTFGIPIQSQQKMSLDQVYVFGLGIYKKEVGNAWDKNENLCAYMKAMYNAGFTVAASELSSKG